MVVLIHSAFVCVLRKPQILARPVRLPRSYLTTCNSNKKEDTCTERRSDGGRERQRQSKGVKRQGTRYEISNSHIVLAVVMVMRRPAMHTPAPLSNSVSTGFTKPSHVPYLIWLTWPSCLIPRICITSNGRLEAG